MTAKKFLLIISVYSLFVLTGCTSNTTTVETGFTDLSGITVASALKQYSINGGGTSCGPANNCYAIYFSGTAGDGVAIKNGGNTWKIFRVLGDTYYTITYNGSVESTTATLSITADSPASGLYSITVTGIGGATNVDVNDTIVAQKY